MTDRISALTLTKAEAARIYSTYLRMQKDSANVVGGLPEDVALINRWLELTIAAVRLRMDEIANGPETVTIELIHGTYPGDMVNFYSRLCGDAEV